MRLTFELVDSGETSLLNMGGCPLVQECLKETQEGRRGGGKVGRRGGGEPTLSASLLSWDVSSLLSSGLMVPRPTD